VVNGGGRAGVDLEVAAGSLSGRLSGAEMLEYAGRLGGLPAAEVRSRAAARVAEGRLPELGQAAIRTKL
jgi:hypothetical protein